MNYTNGFARNNTSLRDKADLAFENDKRKRPPEKIQAALLLYFFKKTPPHLANGNN